MSGFGDLWRVRTRKHIRTMRSIFSSTGPDRATWPRLQETEAIRLEEKRLKASRQLHSSGGTCTSVKRR